MTRTATEPSVPTPAPDEDRAPGTATDPADVRPVPPADWPAIRRELGTAARGVRLRLTLAALLLALGAGAQLLVPVALGRLVDAALAGRGTDALGGPVTLAAAAVVVGALASALGLALGARALDTVLARLRQRLVARALGLRHTTLERAGAGDLVSRATADVAEVGESIGTAFPGVTSAGFTLALTVLGLGVLDPRYLLALLLVLPVQLLAARDYLRRAPRVYTAEREAMADRATEVLDSLHGLATVNAYRLEEHRQQGITARSWQVVRHAVAARRVQNRFLTGINAAEFAGLAAVLAVGFLLVRAGWGTVGETTTAVLFFLALSGPVGRLLFVIDDAQSAAASLSRIVGVIHHAPEPETPAEPGAVPAPAAPRAPAAVELRGVSCSFPGRGRVLEGVDLRIAAGSRVAVVGTSGAGKSTLAAVVAGLLPPETGSVRIGGRPPRTRPGPDGSRRVALLTQEHHVFGGTLRDDLRLARPDAEDVRLWHALERVGAADWARGLDGGLDTVVGAPGLVPTAARAQQLALARLVLADPAVAVLDEAGAEADSRSARALERAMAAATEGRTTLLVAHRLNQARDADRILVLDAGRVREDGSHAELLAAGGRYTALWNAWAAGRTVG